MISHDILSFLRRSTDRPGLVIDLLSHKARMSIAPFPTTRRSVIVALSSADVTERASSPSSLLKSPFTKPSPRAPLRPT